MSDQSDHNAPHDTAAALGVQPATLRRWCAYHKEHLSPGANPPAGQARRFDGRDLEVLRTVRALRDQGLTVAAINDQLGAITFAIVDTEQPDSEQAEIETDVQLLATTNAPSGADSMPASIVTQDYLLALERRLVAVESAKQTEHKLLRDAVFLVLAGAVGALVVVLIIIVVVDLWAK